MWIVYKKIYVYHTWQERILFQQTISQLATILTDWIYSLMLSSRLLTNSTAYQNEPEKWFRILVDVVFHSPMMTIMVLLLVADYETLCILSGELTGLYTPALIWSDVHIRWVLIFLVRHQLLITRSLRVRLRLLPTLVCGNARFAPAVFIFFYTPNEIY